jgi:hypothetical protein
MSRISILNQYYIDLIKKLKTISKKHKDKSQTAKSVFSSIKTNYLTLDKSTDEYDLYIKEHLTNDIYETYKNIVNNEENLTNYDEWLIENKNLMIFKDINIGDLKKILRDDSICHHYISVFLIYTRDITDDEAIHILSLLQKMNYDDELKELNDENDKYKTILSNLLKIKQAKIKDSIDLNLGEMENTTLGKLAKEILQDVDVNKLQKSIGENGDVLKSLGDPDSGFGDIISNVSQKMASKLSSGELNQQNLMSDAMKFASLMPGMFGNNQNQSNGNSNGNSSANMGNMMSMFADLMANQNNNNDMPDLNTMKNMAKNMGNKKNNMKQGFNEGAYRKLAAAKKAKKKLASKNNLNK